MYSLLDLYLYRTDWPGRTIGRSRLAQVALLYSSMFCAQTVLVEITQTGGKGTYAQVHTDTKNRRRKDARIRPTRKAGRQRKDQVNAGHHFCIQSGLVQMVWLMNGREQRTVKKEGEKREIKIG